MICLAEHDLRIVAQEHNQLRVLGALALQDDHDKHRHQFACSCDSEPIAIIASKYPAGMAALDDEDIVQNGQCIVGSTGSAHLP